MKQAFEKYILINVELINDKIELTLSRLTPPEMMEQLMINDQCIHLTFNASIYTTEHICKKASYLMNSKKAYTLNFIMKFLTYYTY